MNLSHFTLLYMPRISKNRGIAQKNTQGFQLTWNNFQAQNFTMESQNPNSNDLTLIKIKNKSCCLSFPIDISK